MMQRRCAGWDRVSSFYDIWKIFGGACLASFAGILYDGHVLLVVGWLVWL
jgi:hypothetical protein